MPPMSGHGSNCGCAECKLGPFARNHYFTGKLLVERDFTDEQRYYIDKLRHHQQQLHGWGVVCGLKVRQHPKPECRDRYVIVEPGTAVDCCGHDIVIREEVSVDLWSLEEIAALRKKNDTAAHVVEICIEYRECPEENIPVLYDDCGCDETRCAPNRILESFDFGVVVDPPAPPEPPERPCDELWWDSLDGCPSCETPNCVVLATLDAWHVGDTILDPPSAATDGANHIVRIDNRSRRLLPSTQTIVDVVKCMSTHDGGGSEPDDDTTGPPGPPGPGFQKVLTRIRALSWTHAGSPQPLVPVTLDSQHVEPGVVVAFTAPVDVSTMDPQHVFQVLTVDPRTDAYVRGFRCACPVVGMIVPVSITEPTTGLITAAQRITPADGFADAAAFIFTLKPGNPEAYSPIANVILAGNRLEMSVRIRGEFVLDADGNAADVQFLRAPELPTGDYRKLPFPPPNDPMCIQGSVFESWFTLPDEAEPAQPGRPIPGLHLVSLNTAPRAVLRTLPNVDESTADAIIAARSQRALVSPDDLRAHGVSDAVIARIRDHIRFD